MTDASSQYQLPEKRELQAHLDEIRHHLHNELLPFWQARCVDEQHGGLLTYYNRYGNPTGETMKAMLGHARTVFSSAHTHRAGYGDGFWLNRAKSCYRFLLDHFWDEKDGGWFWTAERDGTPRSRNKTIYGFSFIIYSFAELAMASGDGEPLEWALLTLDLLQTNAADNCFGGYWEMFEEDWQHTAPGDYGGDRKTLDVHMHLMEAFTNLYAATGNIIHKRRTEDVISLLLERMMHPEYGTGIAQFSADLTPLRAILFKTVWGVDRDVDDTQGRPLDNTSYGHNVEFGWLLNRAVDVLGLERDKYSVNIRKLYDHCLAYGIDWNKGGVYCEGPNEGPARETNKEFWQQAETLIAMLDGVEHYQDPRYWEAYKNVHRFVFDVVINHEVGEWFALFGPDNEVISDHMSHAWKSNYHTVRSMLECERRLESLVAGAK